MDREYDGDGLVMVGPTMGQGLMVMRRALTGVRRWWTDRNRWQADVEMMMSEFRNLEFELLVMTLSFIFIF